MAQTKPVIGILGATGALGNGLARRWLRAGYPLILGSRSKDRATAAAEVLKGEFDTFVGGCDNSSAVSSADLIVLAVPYSQRTEMLQIVKGGSKGKIVVDATVPLSPPVTRVSLPEVGCGGRELQNYLGNDVKVVSAFQNVAADHLADLDHRLECDVLVCGNDWEACEVVIELIGALGLRGWHAGRIENAAAAEALTSVLIFINRHYKIDGAGVRITTGSDDCKTAEVDI